MKRTFGSLLTVLLVLAACGGGETSDTQSSDETTTAPAGSSEPTPPASEPAQEGGTESDASMAVVTIDGTSYEFGDFGPGSQCIPDLYGGFTATLRSEDGSGVFGVELWPKGGAGDRRNTANALIAVDGVEMDLTANPDKEEFWPGVEAGTSLVQSFQVDGNKATGVASFVDEEIAYDASLFPLDPVIGEFTVVCGTEG